METGEILGAVIGILLSTVFNSIILWIVGKLGIGISIERFGTAIVAAFLVAIIGFLLHQLTAGWTGMFGGSTGSTLLHIVGSAIILLIVGKMLPGMATKGFLGAIVAAIAIGLVSWLLGLLLKQIVA
jgi:putative membrane protein